MKTLLAFVLILAAFVPVALPKDKHAPLPAGPVREDGLY
jgi:hypothetical protein